jgi:DNA-binding transcriptional ArsR family regulator
MPDKDPLDLVFHALADPSRRKVIALLREAGELKVGDLAEAFSMSLNGVSKHLKVLETAGLVRRRVVGREHWIAVGWRALEPARDWLDSQYFFWQRRLEALADAVESKEGSEAASPGKGDRS